MSLVPQSCVLSHAMAGHPCCLPVHLLASKISTIVMYNDIWCTIGGGFSSSCGVHYFQWDSIRKPASHVY